MKRIILFLLFLCMINVAFAAWCYQETATTATGCGGLDTGAYACSGTWHVTQTCALTYDEDWDTYGDSGVGQVTYVYINYTMPADTANATWRTKIGQEGEVNNNLPIDCWNQTTVQLKIESDHDSPSVDGYCYNGSSWKGVASDLADPFIYEEGMNWDVPVSDSCSWAGGADWNLDGSDACAISTSTDIDGYALTLTNGAATITGSITSATSLLVQNATLNIVGGHAGVIGS